MIFFSTDVFTVYIKYIFTMRLGYKKDYLTIRLKGLHLNSSVSLSHFVSPRMEKLFLLRLQPKRGKFEIQIFDYSSKLPISSYPARYPADNQNPSGETNI